MGMQIPPIPPGNIPSQLPAVQSAQAQPFQGLPPVQPAQQLDQPPLGPDVNSENLAIYGQMLLGAIQGLIPQNQGAPRERNEPSVFDMARDFNQIGQINPLGEEHIKNKTGDDSGYWAALGYTE